MLIAYSIIDYYALVERALWTFIKLPRPAGGRGHDEVKAPDFLSIGYVDFGDSKGFLVLPNEAKNFGDYTAYESTIREKILVRFDGYSIGLLTGHVNFNSKGLDLIRKANLWRIGTSFQVLPEDTVERKKEVLTAVLNGLSQALEAHYGKTMDFLCSTEITLTVLDKYTVEITTTEGKLIEKIDLRKIKPQLPMFVHNLRPLDYIQWREIHEENMIEFYMPIKWNLNYSDGVQIIDHFNSHCHIGFKWK